MRPRLASILLLFIVAQAAASASAHTEYLAYGPLEGYSFSIESDHTHTEFFLSVMAHVVPADAYYGLCIVTDHVDGRAERDTTCGETVECPADPAACDDQEDPRLEGCAQGRFTSPVPIGDDDLVVVEIRVAFVDEGTGTTCASGLSGDVHLEMH